jgi:hypothetical protein
MDNKLREMLGVPTKENVDYDRIYKFDGSIFDAKKQASVFNIYEHNRGSMDSERIKIHIADIAKAFKTENGCDMMPPILVDINTLIIVDGNCRFSAFCNCLSEGLKDLYIKVIFEDIKKEKIDERVIELNTTQQSWTTINFINNFAERDKGSFRKFRDFCMSHALLSSKNGSFNPRFAIASLGISSSQLKNPNLTITDEQFKFGELVLSFASEIKGILTKEFPGTGIRLEAMLSSLQMFINDNINEIERNSFMKELKDIVTRKKRQIAIPIGSDRKGDWTNFFNSVYVFYIKEKKNSNKMTKEEIEKAAKEPIYS